MINDARYILKERSVVVWCEGCAVGAAARMDDFFILLEIYANIPVAFFQITFGVGTPCA